jgi:hypothetical protein
MEERRKDEERRRQAQIQGKSDAKARAAKEFEPSRPLSAEEHKIVQEANQQAKRFGPSAELCKERGVPERHIEGFYAKPEEVIEARQAGLSWEEMFYRFGLRFYSEDYQKYFSYRVMDPKTVVREGTPSKPQTPYQRGYKDAYSIVQQTVAGRDLTVPEIRRGVEGPIRRMLSPHEKGRDQVRRSIEMQGENESRREALDYHNGFIDGARAAMSKYGIE